jgi:hypothetical protein
LTVFGSLGGNIDTIGSLGGHWQWSGSLRGLCVLFPNINYN